MEFEEFNEKFIAMEFKNAEISTWENFYGIRVQRYNIKNYLRGKYLIRKSGI